MTVANEPSSPPVVERLPDLKEWLAKKSHFLFGPRQTGKTFWIRRTLPDARLYDILDSAVYLALRQRPGRLAEELSRKERSATCRPSAASCALRRSATRRS